MLVIKSYSGIANDAHLQAIDYLENLIRNIDKGLFDPVGAQNEIDNEHFHLIIRRILRNFYKHIEEMYQKPVHGRGTIQSENAANIFIFSSMIRRKRLPI